MHAAQHASIVSLIWSVADDVLRDVYVRGKYRDVILPMTVIRRLDALLEDTHPEVLAQAERMTALGVNDPHVALTAAAGQPFYNRSKFTLKTLLNDPNQLRQNFESYLDGFSPNVVDILERFEFRAQLRKLEQNDAIGHLIVRFTREDLNLSPNPVLDSHGAVRLPGLDNHAMGTVFEELIRRFNEANNEEAGEHFTPRDVVALMARLLVLPVADKLHPGTFLVYDGACGTGGMLTVAEETLLAVAAEQGKRVAIQRYGQEVNDETYAITKADLILKGEGDQAEHIAHGSTLTQDAFPNLSFDFMLSNPPYGKSWKRDLDSLGGKGNVRDKRFVVDHAGDPDFNVLPRSSDGQMLFLVNLLQKMKHGTALGSRIAEVHNGSALFTGDAGSGESNIRRWLIENDWLEAIVALPLNIFYNTGIATYVWVLTNRKPDHRKGKVQLIDATAWHRPLRRNLGARNREMTEADIARVVETFQRFEETEHSKIFPNEHFGYRKVTVDRPLRLQVDFSPDALDHLESAAKDPQFAAAVRYLAKRHGPGPHLDYNAIRMHWYQLDRIHDVRYTTKRDKALRAACCIPNPAAAPVWLSNPARAGTLPMFDMDAMSSDVAPALRGRLSADMTPAPGHFERDPDLRDTEQIPLLEPGGVEGFMAREVWPHVPDAWVDPTSEKIGYEISFNREFYRPTPMRTLEEITTDVEDDPSTRWPPIPDPVIP